MDTPKALAEEFTFSQKGVCYLKLCLEVTLYFEDSLFNHAGEVIEFYRQSLESIGAYVKYYQTENMGKARKTTPKALDMLPFWFKEAAGKRALMMLFLESGPAADDVSDWAFSMRADEMNGNGHVRLMLPVSMIEDSVDTFLALAKRLADPVRFSSGHGGFAVNRQIPGKGQYAGEAREKMYFLSQRYPGIDLSDLTGTSMFVRLGIKCANWLTFINPKQCATLGGKDKLATELGEGIAVHALQHGVMMQAGLRPEIGDVNRNEILPYYHRVGKLLKPLRMPQHSHFLRGDEEITMRWLARFDE